MKRLVYIILLIAITTLSSFTIFNINENGGKEDQKIVQFYPNPATSFIVFDLPSVFDKNYTLQIYNFLGKKLISQQVNSSKISISLDNFYRGLYVYQLRDASGNIEESGKFQILK